MTVNDFKISDGPEDAHGTSWILNESAQVKHGKRSFAQHRAAARIAQAPAMPVAPLHAVPGPQVSDRTEAFMHGVVASELYHMRPSEAARLAGGILGAVIGVKAHEYATRNRRR
jgi:hypothetical protein